MFAKYSPLGLAVSMLPLYAGPFLAGWIGGPLAMLLALVSLFFLAQLGASKDKARGELPMVPYLVMLGGAQMVVVAVVFGLGTIVRSVIGPLDAPQWLPIACTAVGAVIFSRRYRYDPAEAEMMEAIDDAIDQIDEMTPPEDDNDNPER